MGIKDFFANPFGDLGSHDTRGVGRDEVKGFTIDTCYTHDEGLETAIKDKNELWHVVERYKNQEEASNGHEKWCGLIRNGLRKIKSLAWNDTPELNTDDKLE